MRITDADGTTTGHDTCAHGDPKCHCIAPAPVVAQTLIYVADIDSKPATVKLRFHEDGTVTWQKLWNQ